MFTELMTSGSGGGSWESSTLSVTIPANGSYTTSIVTTNKSVYIASYYNNARIAALVYDGTVLDSTVKNYISISVSSSSKKIVLSSTLTSAIPLTLHVYTQG